MKTVESISLAGSVDKENQDYVSTYRNGAILLDGASPLKSDSNYPTHTFVKDFIEAFIKIESQDNLDINEVLLKVIEKLRLTSGLSNLNDSPSASAVIIRLINNSILECIQVGDCKAFIYDSESNSPTEVFPKNKIEFLDKIALDAQTAYLKLGFNMIEARENINNLLLNHRNLMNSDKGYSSLSLSTYNKNLISYRSIKLNSDLKYKVLLASDGFYSGCEDYCPETMLEILNESLSLKSAAIKYRAIEEKDKELMKYPRFKLHDDSTAILLEIS